MIFPTPQPAGKNRIDQELRVLRRAIQANRITGSSGMTVRRYATGTTIAQKPQRNTAATGGAVWL